MTPLSRIKKYNWQPWLERHFNTLIISFFAGGLSPRTYRRQGLKPILDIFLWQDNGWYESRKVWADAAEKLDAGYHIFKLSKKLDVFTKASEKKIAQLAKSKISPVEKIKEVAEIFYQVTNFIWITHVIEYYYNQRLEREVPQDIAADRQAYIASGSYPKKLSNNARMEQAILKGRPLEQVAKEFGWLKVRGMTGEPFAVKDLKSLKVKAFRHKYPRLPKKLQPLFNELRELVYFRTARTDVLYHFLYLCRPIFKEVAAYYHLPYSAIGDYTADSLISGRLKKNKLATIYYYKGKLYFTKKNIIKIKKQTGRIVKGLIAQPGKVSGIAKIVVTTASLDKVRPGDILIAPMTFPQFIMAMKKAAGFVTDEGGLTCHAAIVARELKKPCLTGTKIATKIFKDGDLVEVDADKGVARKIR